ncbi:MAG TPA: efflux RND transporter periplasmic adaptor subunit [Spirochaetia bacterium]|nr:efflux RND transporter periplasmic adaptor subunit [Spirochaetia bacterium]
MSNAVRAALALVVTWGLVSCAREKPVERTEERVPVTTYVVKEQSVPREISCFGTITFLRKIDLSATVDGTVARLFVKEGQTVREGQQLLTLRNVQLELRRQQALSGIDSARSSLDLARARLWEGELAVEARLVTVQRTELEREQKRLEVDDAAQTLANKEELSKVGGVTAEALAAVRLRLQAARNECAMIEKDLASRRIGLREEDLQRDGLVPAADLAARTRQLVQLNTKTLVAEVETARARYESARRELEASEELLKALALGAPAPGIVGAKYVEQGEYVSQNGKLLTLMDTKNVYAALSVQESEMPLLREGMPATLLVEAVSPVPLAGRVDSISPTADPQTGAFLVKAALANAAGKLRPGMFVRATIAYEKPKLSLVVSEKCIFQKKGFSAQVFSVVNGKAFIKQVTLGSDIGGSYALEKGLAKGEVLIESPPPTLREGMNVEMSN